MICDSLIGCVYDNFSNCINTNKKGLCLNGVCNTTIVSAVLSKPPLCKTYKFSLDVQKRVVSTLVNDINGISCTKPGALLESVCYNGICTPYVNGVDKVGQLTGCRGLPDGFMCDTNFVFTDGEKCINQMCIMPENAASMCVL